MTTESSGSWLRTPYAARVPDEPYVLFLEWVYRVGKSARNPTTTAATPLAARSPSRLSRAASIDVLPGRSGTVDTLKLTCHWACRALRLHV